MAKIVDLKEAKLALERIEQGGPTGFAAAMRIKLWKPQDAAYPDGPWMDCVLPVMDLEVHLAKGYVAEEPGNVVDTTAAVSENPAELGDLSSKTKATLVALGRELGLKVNMKMTKDQLIIAIEGSRG